MLPNRDRSGYQRDAVSAQKNAQKKDPEGSFKKGGQGLVGDRQKSQGNGRDDHDFCLGGGKKKYGCGHYDRAD